MSGGQGQRAGIARALAAGPPLLLADEVVSPWTSRYRPRCWRCWTTCGPSTASGYLFIGHDLAVVRGLADRVMVLYLGRICEESTVAEVFGPDGLGAVNHPYTRLLLDPVMHPAPIAA